MNEVRKVNVFVLITILFVTAASIPVSYIHSTKVLLLISPILYALPFIVYHVMYGRHAVSLRIRPVRVGIVLKSCVLYFCLMPVLTLLNTISMLYAKNEAASLLSNMVDDTPLWYTLIVVSILPAVFEEFVYRGILYRTYSRVNPLGAIFMVGLIFGLLHGNLNQFTYAVVLGSFFCLVVEATDSLATTMILHALVNAVPSCLVYILERVLAYVNSLYEEATAAGDTMTLELLDSLVGGQDMTSFDAIFDASQTLSTSTIASEIVATFIPAVIGGTLAFLLFRNIAKSCGRWDYIVSIFKGKGSELVPEYHRIWTPSLIAAAVVMVVEIVMYTIPAA